MWLFMKKCDRIVMLGNISKLGKKSNRMDQKHVNGRFLWIFKNFRNTMLVEIVS